MPTFAFPDDDDSLPPSTPDRGQRFGSGKPIFGDNPSTTPAGPPPPSSAASFTPAGAPSDSYLGSSMMRGVSDQKSVPFGAPPASTSKFTKNLFGSGFDSSPQQPLGRSIAPSRGSRQPSALSREYDMAGSTRDRQPKSFHISSDEEDDEDEDEEEEDEAARMDEQMKRFIEQDIDENEEDDTLDAEGDEDMFLSMSHRPVETEEEEDYAEGDEDGESEDATGEYDDDQDEYTEDIVEPTDLMELVTPAANERARQEAESIFRVSKFRRSAGRRDFKYASMAKNLYTSMGFADVNESPDLIAETEDLIKHLYDVGIGREVDPEKLDIALANAAQPLCELWETYGASLPPPEGEVTAEVGPSEGDEPFRKASFVANLALQLHHARLFERGEIEPRPLPGVLFQWAQESSSVYLTQVREVLYHHPSPSCHSLYWQTISAAQLRGDLRVVLRLLREAGWEKARKGSRGGTAYEGRALENVQRAIGLTCDMLEMCPGRQKHDSDPGDWEILNSDWTLFRIQAKGSFDKLQRFAEGKDRSAFIGMGDSDAQERTSLARLARKAESQVPWDIYEHLQGIYEIALGIPETILDIAQDWCEATVGLFGWWEMGRNNDRSLRMSKSHALAMSSPFPSGEGYFDRLQLAFHAVIDSDFHFNAMNPVEVAVACSFEGNFAAVIGFLRAWSLPVATSVAELASLGQWLPKPETPNLITLGSLDIEDLDMLGVTAPGSDETDGMKDTTLMQYARALAGIEALPGGREGWELAIEVLGRMDSTTKCEDMVGELLQDILDSLTVDSSETVDTAWRMLHSLGMVQYAEETAEAFADQLQANTHRYGEALWYYALAHRPSKARDVLNLLTSVSLVHTTPYPPTQDMDDYLHRLLTQRGRTLEQLAKQDLEAAQLLGRMLSGYATLRKFYDIRDTEGFADLSTIKSVKLRREAMTALAAVIASSDDNIRGGLYDPTRDAVVSEDFILALLGEALPFISQGPTSSVVISLDQMDTLLKATEDIETVSGHIFEGSNTFFESVLSAAPGLKGSSPHDLIRKNTGGDSGSSSWVMTGSSMFASQMQRSLGNYKANVNRGWDWRAGLTSDTTSRDILRILRLNLTRELSKLWLAEADNEPAF